MGEKVVIIDCHYICHRTKYQLKGLSYQEKATGVIFGFLESLQSIYSKFNPCRFIFAWDSSKRKRKVLFPGYKEDSPTTKRKPEDIALDAICLPQFPVVRDEVLPAMGYRNIFLQPGYEADDIIASLVMNNGNDRKGYVVISRDHDLYQLLDHCAMWNPDDKRLFTREHLFKEYGVHPEQWRMVKMLAGCNSDKVPGIEKVGDETAIKYILDTLPHHHKVYKRIVEEREEVIARNKPLVVLPMEGTWGFDIVEDEPDFEGFMNVCMQFGFRSYLKPKQLEKWREILGKESDD